MPADVGDAHHYPEEVVTFLEELWGDGFLSPGGPDEVARIVEGVDLSGTRVLDIGCGSGGATIALAVEHGAGAVVGIDVEETVVAHARARVAERELTDRVQIRLVEPGPLPFTDSAFDIVFSKDSLVHVEDKEALAAEAFRVLRPGGWFLASDWLISHAGEPSAEMAAYIAAEDLGFAMAWPQRWHDALVGAGFADADLRNRNDWYREVARRELAELTGPDRARFEAAVGSDELALQVATWSAMVPVLESGEHCPHHLRARKPG